MITDINSEDRLGQRTFAEHLEKVTDIATVFEVEDADVEIRSKR